MLEAGKPKDLFIEDHLHMTPKGYAIWTQAVRAAVVGNTEAEATADFNRNTDNFDNNMSSLRGLDYWLKGVKNGSPASR